MTKPNDVPQADWDAASIVISAVEAMPSTGNIMIAARAIQAEREACTETVDTLASVISDEIAAGGSPMQIMALSTQRHAVLTASAAIRDRSEA